MVSVIAIAVSLGLAAGHSRWAQAQGDGAATPQQKSALLTLQNAFTSIADSVEPAVVGIHAVTAPQAAPPRTGRQRPQVPQSPGDGGDDSTSPLPGFPRNSPFGDLFPNLPQQDPQTPAPRGTATGSGVIVRKAGSTYYVLTNYHVIEDADNIRVSLTGIKGEVKGRLVGKGDPKSDLALVSVTLPSGQPANRVAKLGDSSAVRVGQWAIAIGNPLDLGQTLTVGVVSARRPDIGRIGGGVADYRDMIQTDASINPGNSGGALVDINGEVIGINTAIASPFRGSVGIGFAIPINNAKSIVDQLIQNGEVIRGWLGVSVTPTHRELSPKLADYYGVQSGALAETVEPDTPAAKAGLQAEDVITQWGDSPIRNFDDLEHSVSTTPPGRRVAVKLVRDKREMTVTVTTEKRPPEVELQDRIGGTPRTPDSGSGGTEVRPSSATVLGITVRGLTASERDVIKVDGVLVTDLADSQWANEAGLFEGDVITRIGATPVRGIADFKSATAKLTKRDTVILRVSRRVGTRTMSSVVELGPSDE
jgi:serine protease Do